MDEKTKGKSELERLLEKNAYGVGLTKEEKIKAMVLILKAVPTEKDCWVCGSSCPDKAIYDTGLCKGHAYYALVTRK